MVLSEEINDVMEFLMPHRYGIPKDDCQNLNIWTRASMMGRSAPLWFGCMAAALQRILD